MRARPTVLAVAVAVAACDCGGGAEDEAGAAYWVGEAGEARVLAVSADGRVLSVAAAAPALEAPVRALAARADGGVVVLQEVGGGAPPGVIVGRDGARVAPLAAGDALGGALFDASEPPWAAAEGPDGRIWVTGRTAPVLFDAGGAYAGRAASLPFATRGIAALADGRMLVTYGANGAALYGAGGESVEPLAVTVGDPEVYSGLDAVAVRPDGGIVLAALRHGVTVDGVLVDVALGEGSLVVVGDPDASARLPGLPSAIVAGADEVVAGPSLGTVAAPACAEVTSPDLRARRGCLAPGTHRGVARLR